MKNSPMHLAMREMQNVARTPLFWAVIGAVILLLGLSGPFDTIDLLPLFPRIAYWAVIVVVTFLSGWFISTWIVKTFEAHRWPFWIEAVLAGLAVGLVISVQVLLVNWVSFGANPISPDYAPALIVNTLAIAVVVTTLVIWTRRSRDSATAAGTVSGPGTPRLLARLPLEKRGALIFLSVQDHYVEVVTTRGRELILMRLGDAIAETEGTQGLQVHRSHWIASGQVRASRREGARAILSMSDGTEIPVSRSYVPNAKKAGLLP